jgi:NADPH:quinone reductase-like Zn-dependent oxidoreductase
MAGEVVAVDAEVEGYKVGDRIMGVAGGGRPGTCSWWSRGESMAPPRPLHQSQAE